MSLKQKVRERQPKNKNHLWEVVQDEWYKIPPSYCYNLVKNYKSRLQQVIAAKGYKIPY